LKKPEGLDVKKKKARGMETLYDGHWVKIYLVNHWRYSIVYRSLIFDNKNCDSVKR
jgi:hypothetical protein